MSKAKFVTDVFAAAYPYIHRKNDQGDYPSDKFEVTAYMTEAENSEGLMKIAEAIKKAASSEFGDISLEKLTSTGMTKQEDDRIKVRFKSKYQPRLQDAKGRSLADDVVIGPGDRIRVSGNAVGWEMGNKKGVSLMMNEVRLVQSVERDDPFGGPEEGFEEDLQVDEEASISF